MNATPDRPSEVGFGDRRQSFGAEAGAYDRFRPEYPEAFLARLMNSWAIPKRGAVVDIGAGTGQLSRVLARLGYAVSGVEPDPRMHAVLADRIGAAAALAGSAEDIPLPGASVDAVMGGQMWHWVQPAKAVPEIARVLRPGGSLAVLWILRDDRVPWVARLGQAAQLPDHFTKFDDSVVPEFADPFGPISRDECAFKQALAPDEFVEQIATLSTVRLASDSDDQLAAVRDLLRNDEDLAGRDAIQMPFVCKCFSAIRE